MLCIFKGIGLPKDLFSYWESIFREDLFLYNSSLLVVGKFLEAFLEGAVELKELYGVVGLSASGDVFEALRAAAFEPNAVRRNVRS